MGCSEMTAMSVEPCHSCQIRVALGIGDGPFTLGQLRSACGESIDTMIPSSWDLGGLCKSFEKIGKKLASSFHETFCCA